MYFPQRPSVSGRISHLSAWARNLGFIPRIPNPSPPVPHLQAEETPLSRLGFYLSSFPLQEASTLSSSISCPLSSVLQVSFAELQSDCVTLAERQMEDRRPSVLCTWLPSTHAGPVLEACFLVLSLLSSHGSAHPVHCLAGGKPPSDALCFLDYSFEPVFSGSFPGLPTLHPPQHHGSFLELSVCVIL